MSWSHAHGEMHGVKVASRSTTSISQRTISTAQLRCRRRFDLVISRPDGSRGDRSRSRDRDVVPDCRPHLAATRHRRIP